MSAISLNMSRRSASEILYQGRCRFSACKLLASMCVYIEALPTYFISVRLSAKHDECSQGLKVGIGAALYGSPVILHRLVLTRNR